MQQKFATVGKTFQDNKKKLNSLVKKKKPSQNKDVNMQNKIKGVRSSRKITQRYLLRL